VDLLPYYTNGKIKEFERKEKEEMDRLVTAIMNETGSDQDNKLEELSQDLQVRFKTKSPAKSESQARNYNMDDLGKALAAKAGEKKSTPPGGSDAHYEG
jgi:hypothetical protein